MHLTRNWKSQLSDVDRYTTQQILFQGHWYPWDTVNILLALSKTHTKQLKWLVHIFFFFEWKDLCLPHVELGVLWIVSYTYANENWEDN